MLGLIWSFISGRLIRAATAILGFIRANPWPAALIASLCLSALLWHGGNVARHERDQARAAIAAMNAQTTAAAKRADTASKALVASTATIVKRKNDEIASNAVARDALLEQLRSRPGRPSAATASVAGNAEAPVIGTGSGLFAEDAEFLVREAARADDTRTSLIACYAQYDAAREMLEGLQTR